MDEVLKTLKINVVSRCRCCEKAQEERTKWWEIRNCAKLMPILQVVPAFICWQLWKRRNIIEHGGNMTKWKVIQEINSNLVKLVKLKYPWIKRVPILIETDSLAMINMIEGKREAPWKIRMEMASINLWRRNGLVQEQFNIRIFNHYHRRQGNFSTLINNNYHN
ncbi:hypothetical protein H5410_036691 [Solanum commersonii]|uniref:RNase H type-1 domain-containing protein n=1 Tax=Solanum commersonii TaxID=4109 RepID=A0A9J5Y489_SOLCO|nr:hypothetical protein H5410_036691 [Solanum commersonii]